MSYRWRPSKSQRRAFAQKMQDPHERAAYEERKAEREEKKRSTSQFDYQSAGGRYVPTQAQHDAAWRMMTDDLTPEQKDACNMVMYGYTCKEKVHHDYIHIVNELIRSQK